MADYTPRELFADWYKSADISMDENILKLRLASIDKILTKNDDSFWLEIVRLYLQLPAKDENQRKHFISFFKEEDSTFPLENNNAIVKALAASCLSFNITEHEENNNVICLSVLVGNFFSNQSIDQKIPVLKYANSFIQENIKNLRIENLDNGDLKNILESDKDPKSFSNEDFEKAFTTLNNLFQSHLNLKEEVNVLWWLLGEHSTTSQKSFKKTGAINMTLIAPFELASQTNSNFGFNSADAFIARSLTIANDGKPFKEEISISEAITSLTPEEKKELVNQSSISDLTPGLLAIKNSLETASEIWAKQNELYLNKKFKPIELASHIYNEYLLLNFI